LPSAVFKKSAVNLEAFCICFFHWLFRALFR